MFKKGFTLIELLVVIAIIAILAAILFPVFAQAREKARQTTCLSNLKQLGTALMLYVDDNHETYPQARIAGFYSWNIRLFPYVKSNGVFLCPSSYADYSGLDFSNYNGISANYSANTSVMGDDLGVKAARVKSPSNVIAIYEASYYIMDPGANLWNGLYSCWLPGAGLAGASASTHSSSPLKSLSGDAYQDFMNGRHNEGINICYADGHAAFEKSATVYGWAQLATKNPFKKETW